MSERNGVFWAQMRFYLTVGMLIGSVTAGAFTLFELRMDHNRDIQRILDGQQEIQKRLDQLFFKENTGLTHLPYHKPRPRLTPPPSA